MNNRFNKENWGILLLLILSFTSTEQFTANANLRLCTSKEEATLTNLTRQELSINNLLSIQNNLLLAAKIKLQDAIASQNAVAQEYSKNTISGINSKIDTYKKLSQSIYNQKKSILQSCQISNSKTPPKKSINCNETEIYQLGELRRQYVIQETYRENLVGLMNERILDFKVAVSKGELTKAASLQLNNQSLNRKYQEASAASELIKKEFDLIKSNCNASGLTLPSPYVPVITATNSPTPSPSSTIYKEDLTKSCSSANCLPDKWLNSEVSLSSVEGVLVHLEPNIKSNLVISCDSRGQGSQEIFKPRIFVALTTKKTSGSPVESDFSLSNNLLKSNGLEQFDFVNVSRFPPYQDLKLGSLIGLVIPVDRNICETTIPVPSNLRNLSKDIATVGFFFQAETKNSKVSIFLGGAQIDQFDDPEISLKKYQILVKSNQLAISINHKNVFSRYFVPKDEKSIWWNTTRTFGSVCFLFDDATEPKCYKVTDYPTLDLYFGLENLKNGKHTLRIYVEGSSEIPTASIKLEFDL